MQVSETFFAAKAETKISYIERSLLLRRQVYTHKKATKHYPIGGQNAFMAT